MVPPAGETEPGSPVSLVPPPPQGPGVAAPFAAPPSDRNKRGMWIGLGVGALVLLLCCVGGVVGVGVVVVSVTDQMKRQSTEVVTTYLESLLDRDFGTARRQLCEDLARDLTRERLSQQMRERPFTGYRLDKPNVGAALEVTAHLTVTGGEVIERYELAAEGDIVKICAIR